MNKISIEECCEILDAKRIPITSADRKSGIYPYYGANGVQDYVNDFIFDDDLVLLAEDGGNFGSKNRPIAYRVSGKFWVNNHAHVLKPKKGLNVDFLCYSLMFYNTDKIINGATRQKLTQAVMRKMRIPNLEYDKQLEIVNRLNKIDDIKSKKKDQLSFMDDLIKARFVEMFGDPIVNSKRLPTVYLTKICEIIDGDRGVNYPKENDFYDSGYCLFLNAKNVTKNGFNFDKCLFITKEKDMQLRKGRLCRGDIVLTTRGTVGNLAFYSESIPFEIMRINSGMVILRMNHKLIDDIYFIEYFKFQLNQIKNKNSSGSAQPQLPISSMNKISVLLPNRNKQNQFASFVQQVDKSKFVSIEI